MDVSNGRVQAEPFAPAEADLRRRLAGPCGNRADVRILHCLREGSEKVLGRLQCRRACCSSTALSLLGQSLSGQ